MNHPISFLGKLKLEGFYQALHYHRKFGLSYNTIFVIAHKFVGIWKVNKLPEQVLLTADI